MNSKSNQSSEREPRIVSILPHDVDTYSGDYGSNPRQRFERALSTGYQPMPDSASPLRYSKTDNNPSPYRDIAHLKHALTTNEQRIGNSKDWLNKARGRSRESQHAQEQDKLETRFRQMQEQTSSQTKANLRETIPMSMLEDPSVRSQQPSMTSRSSNRLETNSIIELETRIQ